MLHFLGAIVMGTLAVFGGLFGHPTAAPTAAPTIPAVAQSAQPQFGAFEPSGGTTYYLQASVSASQTTLALTSFKEPGSSIAYTMSYLGSSIEYATIDPQSTHAEFVSFSGITQNADGTATLTGVVRGLGRTYPYTASTTLAAPHPGQTRFILSNPPSFYNQFAIKGNNETITGTWTFTSFPVTPSTPAATTLAAGFTTLGTSAQAASSTASGAGPGGTTYVIPTSMATDTPKASCTNASAAAGAGCAVIAQLTGGISSSFLSFATSTFAYTNGELIQNLGKHLFVATTTQTWTVPSGITLADVECVGAGAGGSGGANGTQNTNTASAGGGGGAYIRGMVNLTGTTSVLITVGAGGPGGAGGSAGTNGGNTLFSTFLSANGGTAGTILNGTGSVVATGGAGGTASSTASTTVLSIAGGDSGVGFAIVPTSGTLSIGGYGGASFFGAGASQAAVTTGAAAGKNASVWGAGGSGAAGLADTIAAGGNGQYGACVVHW